DRTVKKWKKTGQPKSFHTIVPKGEKAANEPDGNQVLVELTAIKPNSAGLWYAKWRVGETDGGTLLRLGANLPAKTQPKGKVPEGKIRTVVPIDTDHAEWADIPDPRVACGPEAAKGQREE